MPSSKHTLLTGETLDLSALDPAEVNYFARLQRDAQQADADYFDLLRQVKGPEALPRRGGVITPAIARSALYRAAHDIADRVGVQQGHVLAPNVDTTGLAQNGHLLSMTEAAEHIGITRPAVHQALREGRLKGQQVGNAWIVHKADADAFRREREGRTPR